MQIQKKWKNTFPFLERKTKNIHHDFMELSKSSVYKFTAVNIYIFKRGDLKSLIQTSTKRNQKKRIEPNTNQAQGNKKYYCKLNDREQKNNREKSTKSKASSLKKSENFTSTDQLT